MNKQEKNRENDQKRSRKDKCRKIKNSIYLPLLQTMWIKPIRQKSCPIQEALDRIK